MGGCSGECSSIYVKCRTTRGFVMRQHIFHSETKTCYTTHMIGLMDCNNFFVSCERLFRPDLRNRPVAVLSSNDGCIVARSQEVKDLGISMGVPLFQVKDICKKHNIVLFSSNFKLYRDISSRVMSALKDEFEICEQYSIDESFFTISESATENDMEAVRARIMQKTGIPVSIGVAKTKTLAKIASTIAKKGTGVCMMNDSVWNASVKDMSCGSVWGIGRRISASLTRDGIYTISDLLTQDNAFIRSRFGVMGERVCMELRGTSAYPVGVSVDSFQESYASTRSFGKPVTSKLVLMSALSYHVEHIAEKLRMHNLVASIITIEIRGSRFGEYSHRKGTLSSVFSIPTSDTFVLTKEVEQLLDTLFDSEIPYKKAGVVVSGIAPESYAPVSLFGPDAKTLRTDSLSALSDSLNSRFGKGSLIHASTLGTEKWQEHKTHMSPEYTTSWSQIACIKAI